MPARNVHKIFVKDQIYHVYNRGIDGRKIFMDDQDYRMFLACLKYYLSPPPKTPDPLTPKPQIALGSKNLSKEVDLLAFALMPNHFHLELKQKTIDGMTKLLRRVCTRYVMYFNEKYRRRGALFEGPYKAVEVTGPREALYVSYYLHTNPDPEALVKGLTLSKVRPSKHLYHGHTSLPYYLGQKKASWLKTKELKGYLTEIVPTFQSYEEFLNYEIKNLNEVLKDKILG
jgi:putative transposase